MNRATLLVMVLVAADWPQFRGPNASGVADGAELPLKWSRTENLAWSVKLPGPGLSCPIVVGDKVFVTACSGPRQERLHVLAFAAATGKKLWQRNLTATGSTMHYLGDNSMAAPTPVADAKAVYALFATGDLAAFDHAGTLLWYRALVNDYPTITNNLGMAASPVLAGGVLIVPMENKGDDSFLAGLSLTDGTNVWKKPRPRGINWVTPLVLKQDGKELVFAQSSNDAVAYKAATGELAWTAPIKGGATEPSPAPAGDAFVTFANGLVALKPTGDGTPGLLWQTGRLNSRYSTPLVYHERVYTINTSGVLVGTTLATGKVATETRLGKERFWASPVAADGKVYAADGGGKVWVVDITAKEPKVLATNDLGERFQASPAIAVGRLFLRSNTTLFCVGKAVP